jgi:4-hydroxy-tetrahydrodipicolinate synthase
LADAMPLQYQLLEFFDTALRSGDFPEGFRMGVELRGFQMGAGRQPLSDAQKTERAALKQELQQILSNLGYMED